eukprot:2012805-Rhodomonas_salina.1
MCPVRPRAGFHLAAYNGGGCKCAYKGCCRSVLKMAAATPCLQWRRVQCAYNSGGCHLISQYAAAGGCYCASLTKAAGMLGLQWRPVHFGACLQWRRRRCPWAEPLACLPPCPKVRPPARRCA